MAGINRRQMMTGAGAAAGLSALALGADLRTVLAQPPRRDDALLGGSSLPLDANAPPPAVPGATMVTKGWPDAIGYGSDGSVSTLTHVFVSSLYSVFSPGGVVLCPLDLPRGATLRRVDMYGYRGVAGTQSWALLALDVTTGIVASVDTVTSPSGSGIVQTTINSLVLAPAGGVVYLVDLLSTTATNAFVGVVYQYTDPRKSFVPVTPFRAYDSRWPGGLGALGANQSRVVSIKDARNTTTGAVTGADVVPAGAAAIAYNLTITGTVGGGFLAITAGDAGSYSASAINWSSTGLDLANGGNAPVDSSRQVKVWGGFTGSAQFVVDVTGYYI